MRKTVSIALILILATTVVSCTVADGTDAADPNAELLAKHMGIDESFAEELLSALRQAGLTGDISHVFPDLFCEYERCYKVWESLICYEVVLEGSAVLEIRRDGVLMHPSAEVTEAPSPASSLEIVSVSSPVTAGEMASVSVRGEPHAAYTVRVYYSSGISHASGLEEKTADADGRVSWMWRVGAGTKPGTYRIEISDGTATLETCFTVEATA